MKQVVLVRGKVLKLIQNLRIYISCLPDTEIEALDRLRDPQVHMRIADYVLMELGEIQSTPAKHPEYFSKTLRAVKVVGAKKKRRYRKLSESWQKPKTVTKVSITGSDVTSENLTTEVPSMTLTHAYTNTEPYSEAPEAEEQIQHA